MALKKNKRKDKKWLLLIGFQPLSPASIKPPAGEKGLLCCALTSTWPLPPLGCFTLTLCSVITPLGQQGGDTL